MWRPEAMIGVFAIAGFVWFMWSAVSWILRGIFGPRAQEIPGDPNAEYVMAKQILSRPIQRPDGSWQAAVVDWKTCDPPMQANDLTVHDRNAPGHDARTCRHCQPSKGFSGVSYRPN